MSSKSPICPMPEPQHFSDYGFEPQIDYFQVLEEARKYKRDTLRSVDALHFKLQKPISKEESNKSNKKKKKKWWKNALLFWRWKWFDDAGLDDGEDGVYPRSRVCRGAVSGPVYITENRSGWSTPSRTSCRPASGPLAGTLTPTRNGEVEIPYLSLRELNIEQQQYHRIPISPMPIYLVT
ncbi:PREDICTED: uncharacterized protein LOC104606200 [Nelumbo nucifera]|uniref:Uncharacterized protein LOC104606200 n=1 Tax=Nelumbo nucifera TaxID=4432 RepID=A0A1U8AP73_NELNU|nr:PREDICTED: uncharacterized protein LOC104606200 [Nelumbo nucifera]